MLVLFCIFLWLVLVTTFKAIHLLSVCVIFGEMVFFFCVCVYVLVSFIIGLFSPSSFYLRFVYFYFMHMGVGVLPVCVCAHTVHTALTEA